MIYAPYFPAPGNILKFSLTACVNRFNMNIVKVGKPVKQKTLTIVNGEKKEKQMKKALAILLIALTVMGGVFANGAKEEETSAKTQVYFLNFKPEVAEVYETVVKPAFEAENPEYELKVVTAASGTYATTLKSEMAKSNPPAIFQTNGPVGLQGSKNDVAALDDTKFYSILADTSMALTQDGKVVAIPYAVEGYGIIYNYAIMRAYFALPGAKASSMDEIDNFATLKAVVEDMTAKKDQLGIKGVFASTSRAAGNDWRWQTHLFNVPLEAEFDSILDAVASKTFEFKYAENFKHLWDLYINNSCTPAGLVGAKTVDDSMAEFALGQCAMVQNGNWGAGQILGCDGNTVADEDIKFMPLYMGLDGEESQGLCVGTENYLCINKNASAEAQAAADTFLDWLFNSKTGKQIVKNDLGFITPFNTFADDELPADPLAKEVNRWMNIDGITSIPWVFGGIPSEQWKADFGASLLDNISGADFAASVKVAQDAWAREAKIANR